MRLAYLTDIHADFEAVRSVLPFLQSHSPDLVLAAGDYLNTGFATTEEMIQHRHLSREMWTLVARSPDLFRLSPQEALRCLPALAERSLNQDSDSQEKEVAARYLDSLDKADDHMTMLYRVLKDSLDASGLPYLCLPGNYDKDLADTPLRDRDLHHHVQEVRGLRLGGYGGASPAQGGVYIPSLPGGVLDARPFPAIPVELTVPYNEFLYGPHLVSEPLEFFLKEQPDIACLHNPIYKYLDRDQGSRGMHQYALAGKTALFLSGHMHEARGVQRVQTSVPSFSRFPVALNPGNFGREKLASEKRQEKLGAGYFALVELDETEKRFETAHFYCLAHPKSADSVTLVGEAFRNQNNELRTLLPGR